MLHIGTKIHSIIEFWFFFIYLLYIQENKKNIMQGSMKYIFDHSLLIQAVMKEIKNK